MIKIGNNLLICLNRGDTGTILVPINIDSPEKSLTNFLTDNHKFYFGIMDSNTPFECGLVKKVYSRDDIVFGNTLKIELTHLDTAYLLPGVYYWTLKLVEYEKQSPRKVWEDIEDSDLVVKTVDTIVARKKFIILE